MNLPCVRRAHNSLCRDMSCTRVEQHREFDEHICGDIAQEYLSPPIRCYQHSNHPLNTAARRRQMRRIEYSIRYKGYSIVKEISAPLVSPLEMCTDHNKCRFKCIVRPLAVRAYNVHGLQHIEDGWRGHAYVDPATAVFKHVRCRGGSVWE